MITLSFHIYLGSGLSAKPSKVSCLQRFQETTLPILTLLTTIHTNADGPGKGYLQWYRNAPKGTSLLKETSRATPGNRHLPFWNRELPSVIQREFPDILLHKEDKIIISG